MSPGHLQRSGTLMLWCALLQLACGVTGDDDGRSGIDSLWILSKSPQGDPIRGIVTGADGFLWAFSPSYVYGSADTGAHWVLSLSGRGTSAFRSLGVLPNGTPIVGGFGLVYYAWLRHPWESFDWVPPPVVITSFVTTRRGIVFAGTQGGGLWRTYDSLSITAPWHPAGAGVTSNDIRSLLITADGLMMAGTSSSFLSVFRSTDEGGVWSGTGTIAHTTVSALAADSSGLIYAGTTEGIYRTSNRGTEWIYIKRSNAPVTALAVNARGDVFAAHGPVLRSDDRGVVWSNFSAGLPELNALSLAMDPRGYLFVGTADGSIYRTARSTLVYPP